MRVLKTMGLILLVVCALGAAGFSLFRTFLYKPPDGLTDEQRAKAMKAVADFGGAGKAGAKSKAK
jgi:hypothetical protein